MIKFSGKIWNLMSVRKQLSRITIIIIIAFLVLIVGFFANFIFSRIKYSYSIDWEIPKQYIWIFQDSVKKDIDLKASVSFVRDRDVLNGINYKYNYPFWIWEFKDLNGIDLEKIRISQNINLHDIKVGSGVILNQENVLEFTVKYDFAFKNSLELNLERESKIIKSIKGPNYLGFYGIVKKMALSDIHDGHQIIFDYIEGQTPTVLLFYKGHHSFYLIIANALRGAPLDENIIRILNLE